jgi:hypothetical protein
VQLSLCRKEDEPLFFMQRSRCNADSVRPELGNQPQKGGCVMKLGKLVLGIASLSVLASFSYAQPSATLSIHLDQLGPSYNETDVSTLTPLPASAPQSISIDLSEFGSSDFFFVQVTVRGQLTRHDPNAWQGISIINTYVNLAGTGLTIYEGFTVDEAGNDGDARKNVNSHILGNPISDCAANSGLRDNGARAWQSNPPAPGGPLAGQPAAVGKSTYGSPRTSTAPFALYSFVVRVPKQVGVYQIAFDRVLSGGTANTDLTVKTSVLGNSPIGPAGGFVQSQLTVLNGQIEVIPEPASMIALGSGLVGLLALRRRRSN